MLAVGLAACVSKRLAWPPSLPEFRELCFGLGPADDEIALAMDGKKGVFADLLRRTISSWDWLNLPTRELDRRLRANYDRALMRYQLEVLNVEYIALTDQSKLQSKLQKAGSQEVVNG